MPHLTLKSPVGPLRLTEEGGTITALAWVSEDGASETGTSLPKPDRASRLLANAAAQIDAYFYCQLSAFDLPLSPAGSRFQRAVWDAMRRIPAGQARTYGAIAKELDASPQAVGTACGANPIPILIPCHRVVAAGDRLGGYSGHGGLDTKRFLLTLEGWPGVAQGDLFSGQPGAANSPSEARPDG